MGVIIDFKHKANEVRFYIGDKVEGSWGDDFAVRPYECNADNVYGEYVDHTVDIAFPFDWFVLEPADGELNSPYSKEDFQHRTVPCIIGVPPEVHDNSYAYDYSYSHWAERSGITRIYYGDPEELLSNIPGITNRTTAMWIPRSAGDWLYGAKCSHCKNPQSIKRNKLPNYCGECGSRMLNGGMSWREAERSET